MGILIVVAALVAIAGWWLGTALVLALDRMPRGSYRWSLSGAALLLCLALFASGWAAGQDGLTGHYAGFVAALTIWGCLELAFLTGLVTGPRRHACPAGCGGWKHFGHGVAAILHHELLLAATCGILVWLHWAEPNKTGLEAFLVLWFMRHSAKLNLFLGVPNHSADFLPEHLRYLTTFFRNRPVNLLFPVSVTAGTLAAVAYLASALSGDLAPGPTAGDALVGMLLLLAVLEHWMMILPLRAEALWAVRPLEAPVRPVQAPP